MPAEPNQFSDGVPVAEAVVETRRPFSVVWIIPLIALLIGGWLVYRALSEIGPTISIVFESAEGIVAGKTKIKYKEVEAGVVNKVELSKDLSKVVVTATMANELEDHLTENTRFWVEKARLSAGRIEALGTLLSGVYIAMDPGGPGRDRDRFEALESPPTVAAETPGRRFLLKAETLGSLDAGTPVYFRQIQVGKVIHYTLGDDGGAVRIEIFIDAPYDRLVRENTRFWNASGVSANLTTEGFELKTESLTALLIGGVAFSAPDTLEPQRTVGEDHVFQLYASKRTANEPVYTRTERFLLYFDDSVRGLNIGSPVEFRGIKIGQVLDLKLEGTTQEMKFRIPVLVEIEPDRIHFTGPRLDSQQERARALAILVENGFRAQLKTGNLLTGQLYVDFEFFPDAAPATLEEQDGYWVVPTAPTSLTSLLSNAVQLLDKLQKLPIEEIGVNLNEAIGGASRLTNSPQLRESILALDRTLEALERFATKLDNQLAPALQATLDEARTGIREFNKNIIQEEAPVYQELTRALQEMAHAARSIRLMADYLERHPEALLKGKSGTQ